MNEVLRECLEDTLRDTLGYSPAQALIYNLNFQPRGELATEISNQMRQLLGSGALVLERMISKSIYDRLGVNIEEGATLDLASTVNTLKGQVAPMKQRMR